MYHIVCSSDAATSGRTSVFAFLLLSLSLPWSSSSSLSSSVSLWSRFAAPFVDNWWSTSSQPGGSCGNSIEVSPNLHSAVAALSMGPVTPGDGVNFSDPDIILRTCTASGRLLQPDRAATTLDAQIIGRVFPSSATPNGEVWATYSLVAGRAFGHILGASLQAPFQVTQQQVMASLTDVAMRAEGGSTAVRLRMKTQEEAEAVWLHATDLGIIAYSVNTTSMSLATLAVQPFNASSPISLPANGETDFQLWHTAPIFSNGWSYLGELSKWVPVASARTKLLSVAGPDLAVEVEGQAGELVSLSFYNSAGGGVVTVQCTLNAAGEARVLIPAAQCIYY